MTQLGWLGWCPIYITGLDTEPVVEPRHWLLYPLLWLTLWAYGAVFWWYSACDPTFVPQWPIRVTEDE